MWCCDEKMFCTSVTGRGLYSLHKSYLNEIASTRIYRYNGKMTATINMKAPSHEQEHAVYTVYVTAQALYYVETAFFLLAKKYQPSLAMLAGRDNKSGGGGTCNRSRPLWTCDRCHRNNEAKLDACHFCRSRAPSTVGPNTSKNFPTRFTSGNPFERFVQNGSSKNDTSISSSSISTSTINSGRCSDNPSYNSMGRVQQKDGWGQEPALAATTTTANRCRDAKVDHGREWSSGNPDLAGLFPELPEADASYGYGGGRGGRTSKGRYAPTPPAHHRRTKQPPPPLPRVPIDAEAAKTWIYPVNYPVRQYQLQIVTEALFKNTLVALPTGLGKTLIAAVVMYNYYRW